MSPPYALILLTSTIASFMVHCGQAHPDSDLDYLARNISHGLLTSKVFGELAHFTFHDPYGVFFRVSTRMLARAGFYDPKLADIAAHAGHVLGTIPSTVYFRTIGYEVAIFLDRAGLVSAGNVIPFSHWLVKSVELEACSNGISGPETVANAVVYGIIDVLGVLGLTDKGKITELFHLFADTLHDQAKQRPVQVVYIPLDVEDYF